MKYAHIIAEVLKAPWAITDTKFDAIVSVLARCEAGERYSEEEIRAAVGERKQRPEPWLAELDADGGLCVKYSLEGQAIGGVINAAGEAKRGNAQRLVAVIPVHGIIMPRAANFDMSQTGTGVDALTQQFRQALANPNVVSILFDFDSPGGSVYGVDELAAEIYDARAQKKIVAQVNPFAASAAYYLAAQASEIAITPSGEAGSIGVRAMHQDLSKALEMKGIKVTHISAGKYKTEGNSAEPLSADAAAYLQQRVDDYYGQFVDAVARGRGVKAADVRNGMGEGRVVGAKDAKRLGMVDRIATMDETLARLGVGNGKAAAAAASPSSSPNPNSTTASAETTEVVSMSTPTTPATAVADQGLAAERERCSRILQLAAAHNIAASQAHAWIADNKSVETVQSDILSQLRSQATSVAQPSGEEVRAGARVAAGSAGRASAAEASKRPWASFGEFLMATRSAEITNGRDTDPRLFQAAASGLSEAVPADGGFFVMPDMSGELLRRTYELGQVSSRVRRQGVQGNGLVVNAVDESSRADGSRFGGVQVYWANEADTVTAKKPKFRQIKLTLNKLMGLYYATDELLQDVPALGSIATEAFAEELNFKIEDGIFNGAGAGQMLGFMNSKALVTVAKEAGQAANTIVVENVVNMWSRCWGRSRQNAGWFINQDIEPQLLTMGITIGVGGAPIYMPAGGLSAAPFATLFGRPVIPVEYCATLGTVGDIVLADLSQYFMIDKDGMQQAQSVHVRFLNDEQVFRVTYRVDGQPWWNAPLTPYKGTATKSPFVALATRA